MKKYTFIICLILLSNALFAQYQKAYNMAKLQEKQEKYYEAILSYTAAQMSPDAPANNDVNTRINLCAKQLMQQQRDLKMALASVEKEKKKSDSLLRVTKSALARAEELQRQVELAMFDKAVKDHNKEWKGFKRYWNNEYSFIEYSDGTIKEQYGYLVKEGKDILLTIDTLVLTYLPLHFLPEEIKYCTNLKTILLYGSPQLDWHQAFSVLSSLSITDVEATVYTIDSIPSELKKYVTGIHYYSSVTDEIPLELLAMKQLKYLYLDGELAAQNNFTNLRNLFELTNLKELSLTYCSIDTLPNIISNLKDVTVLKLGGNYLSFLPSEIGKLTNLTTLNLYSNQIKKLPVEIGNLKNLTFLYLAKNKLSSLPEEVKNLTNLTELNLSDNNITESEKQKITNWLPNCKIEW